MGDGTKPERVHERMLAAMTRPGLTWRERTVLGWLAYFDGSGGAWPSQGTLAAMAQTSRASIAKALQGLREKGWVRWQRRHGDKRAPNYYEIAYDRPFGQCQQNVTVAASQCQQNTALVGGEPMSAKCDMNLKTTPKALTEEQSPSRPMSAKCDSGGEPAIGFCMSCGCDHFGTDLCLMCGDDAVPFIMAPHEVERGEILMPGGIVVSGLDTAEGRLLFLSEDGREALRKAYLELQADLAAVH